jgi:hypothetical protein
MVFYDSNLNVNTKAVGHLGIWANCLCNQYLMDLLVNNFQIFHFYHKMLSSMFTCDRQNNGSTRVHIL